MIDKIVYTNGIQKVLDNPKQFEKLSIDQIKGLNFILNCEQKVIDIRKLKNKNQINEDVYNKLRPVGILPGVRYCLSKVHKKFIDGYPDFRSILSAIRKATNKISKCLVPVLKDLTCNECSVKDSKRDTKTRF